MALLSAATLAFEVLLVRLFAIEQFHHFAYMAIGIAMLGYGASGTILALAAARTGPGVERHFPPLAILTALTMILSVAAADRVPLDPSRLAWDPSGWWAVLALYGFLTIPFVAGAGAVLVALSAERDRPGTLYGASFLGAGLGSVLVLAVLRVVPPDRALALPPLLAAGAGLLVARGRWTPPAAIGAVVALGAAGIPPWRLDVTPFKALPQVEAFPGAVRTGTHASPVGWVVAVDAPAFRHAPGLSLAYRGAVPAQTAVFSDAEFAGAVMRAGDSLAPAFLGWLPSAAPYVLRPSAYVLVLGAGGDTEVRTALAAGARHVTAVELNPGVLEAATHGARLAGASVRWVAGDARGFAARAAERFDVIAIPPAGSAVASAGGLHALGEDYLHTIEAYALYLERLRPGGVLAVTRWLTAPPRENLRVTLTAAAALRRVAPDHLRDGLVVMHSWGTATTLVAPSGLDRTAVARLATWAASRQFDLDWAPHLARGVRPFHALPDDVLATAAEAALAGPAAATAFTSTYPFDVAPVRDAQPYPHHYLRAGGLARMLRSDRGTWLPFAEWGYLALLATLAQSLVLGIPVLALPLIARVRPADVPVARVVGYFAAIGIAYLTAEIGAIQQLTLLLGHPVYAVTAVLAMLLVSSGAGSVWSERLPPSRGWRAPAAAGVLCILAAAGLLPMAHTLVGAPLALRTAAALAVIAPLGFVMGMPFPLGVRKLAAGPGSTLAWAWAANGVFSVVSAPLAALMALELGSPAVLGWAATAYLAAAAAIGIRRIGG